MFDHFSVFNVYSADSLNFISQNLNCSLLFTMAKARSHHVRINRRLSHVPKSKKYHSIQSKLKIIDEARKTSFHQASSNHNIDRSNIRQWLRHETQWRALTLQEQRSMRFLNTKTTENEQTFKELNDWVKEKLDGDHPITSSILIEHLLEIDDNLGNKSYNALKHMCYNFMDKYGYSFRTPQDLLKTNDEIASHVEEFQTRFKELIELENWQNHEIYNMDQTSLPVELLPSKIISKRGSKFVSLKTKGQTKEKVSGFLLARADGKRCTPMIVYKGAPKGLIYREVNGFNDDNLVCVTQKKAWCDNDVMTQWIEKVWKKEAPNQRKLLILDNYAVHEQCKEQLEYSPQIKVIFLPANSTRLLQPLDLTVNKLMKNNLRDLWVKRHDTTNTKLSRREIANRVVEAWQSIQNEQVEIGFRKSKLCRVEMVERMEIESMEIEEISYNQIRD